MAQLRQVDVLADRPSLLSQRAEVTGHAITDASGALLPIVLRNVSRSFSSRSEVVRAVHGVSLTVPPGALIGVYGVSGSGKSTLLNLIAGLDVADEGEVLVGGQNLSVLGEDERASLRLREIGVVFQDDNILDELTAMENVMLPLEGLGRSRAQAREEAGARLATVGVENLAGRFPEQMSRGQRQRVGIARALVADRRVLLADEPTAALDAENARGLHELLRTLSDDGVTVVVATHDPRVRPYCDTVYEMVDGCLHEVSR